MNERSRNLRILVACLAILTVFSATDSWAQNGRKKNKGSSTVTKALKKVDRQILSYSPEKARQALEPVMEEDDPRVEAALGEILCLEQDFDAGVEKLKNATKKSDDPILLVALGDAQTSAKSRGAANSAFQKAIDEAEAILAEDPKDSGALLALGIAQQRTKQYDDAVSNLSKAMAADSGNPRIPYELGMTKMAQGDNQGAFDHLSAAIDLYSGYAYAYYYRALAANQINRKDITVNDLDRFLALAPDAPEAAKAQRILQAARG